MGSKWNLEEVREMPLFFIVGMGRSGTTMLRTVLDANPNIAVTPESKLIIHLRRKYQNVTRWDPAIIHRLVKDLYTDIKFYYWNIPPKEIEDLLLSYSPKELSFPIICKLIYLSYKSQFPKEKILLIGDKNPIYTLFIPELLDIFPDAKFIHLVRDYRDTILSNSKNFKVKAISRLAQKWVDDNNYVLRQKEKNPESYLLVKYEDFVRNPIVESSKLCSFLNIEFDLGMINFSETIKKGTETAKEYSNVIHELFPELLNKINTNQIDKWKLGLSVKKLQIAHYIAGKSALYYGYQPSPELTEKTYYIRYLWAKMITQYNRLIIKGYYILPFYIRNFLRKIFHLIYKYLHLSTSYSYDEYLIGQLTEQRQDS